MSGEASELWMAFASLGQLNAVKRAFRATHIPMRQLPACLAREGCGYALCAKADQLFELEAASVRLGIGYRVFCVQANTEGERFELQKEVSRL